MDTSVPRPNGNPSQAGLPLRILVVEDDGDNSATLACLLRFFGHEVQIAPDGLAGLTAARVEVPDVVILDLAMPRMDGYELARRLRELPAKKRPLLIAVTGYGRPEDRQRSQDAGIDLHLLKPVDSRLLEKILIKFQDLASSRPYG